MLEMVLLQTINWQLSTSACSADYLLLWVSGTVPLGRASVGWTSEVVRVLMLAWNPKNMAS